MALLSSIEIKGSSETSMRLKNHDGSAELERKSFIYTRKFLHFSNFFPIPNWNAVVESIKMLWPNPSLQKCALDSSNCFHWNINFLKFLAGFNFIIKGSFWQQTFGILEISKENFFSVLTFCQICFQKMAFHYQHVILSLNFAWDKALVHTRDLFSWNLCCNTWVNVILFDPPDLIC